jgi:hypothetical protein
MVPWLPFLLFYLTVIVRIINKSDIYVQIQLWFAHPLFWLEYSLYAYILYRLVIQLGKHWGIKTINVIRREEWRKELDELGADEIINSANEGLHHTYLLKHGCISENDEFLSVGKTF